MLNVEKSGKINEIRFLRERYGIGPKEAKDLVDSVVTFQNSAARGYFKANLEAAIIAAHDLGMEPSAIREVMDDSESSILISNRYGD